MNKYKIYYLKTKLMFVLILFSISTIVSFSQTPQILDKELQYEIKKIVPPSPDAASLGKYGDIPVSLNSGTPQISIPLYEITGSDLSLPISLSYHGTGLQVAEIASSVGLGWALNAGGVITRTVNGWPDEYPNGYNTVLPYYNNNIKGTLCDAGMMPSVLPCEWRMKAASGELDLEPDELNFNFNGYTGRIIINDNNEIVCFPEQSLKIEGSLKSEWTITTPDGTKYCFYEPEHSQFRYGSNYISSWYLSHIVSAKTNEVISFEYERNGTQLIFPDFTYLKAMSIPPKQSASKKDYFLPHQVKIEMVGESTNVARLSKISFPKYGLNVLLEYLDDRKDVTTQKVRRVAKLDVVDQSKTLIKSFTFNNNAYFENGNSVWDKRLKLLSVVDNLSKAKYSFDYIDNNDMPAYNSPDVDHWGFFNKANNTTLTPPMSLTYISSYESNNSSLSAVKEANPEASKSGILSKIQYPTGGFTEFSWEPHMISDEDFYEERKLGVSSACQSGNITMTQLESGFADYPVSDDADMPINVKMETFIVKDGSQASFSVYRSGLNQTGYCRAYLYKSSESTEPLKKPLIFIVNIFSDKNSIQIFDKDNMYLYPGTYHLFTVTSRNKNGMSIRAEGSYNEKVLVKYGEKIIGGLRIQGIRSHDGIDTKNDKTMTYSYKRNYTTPAASDEPAGYSRSSGKLFVDPYHSNYGYEYIDPATNSLIMTSYLVDYYGDSNKTKGSHIGYGEVTEIISGKEGGVKTTVFDNSEEPDKRNLILKEKMYDSKNTLVKYIEKAYATSSFKSVSNCILQIKLLESYKSAGAVMKPAVYIINFSEGLSTLNQASWYGLKETKEKIFNSQGKDSLESKINYYYEGLDRTIKHTFPTKKTYLSSEGNLLTEKTLYALDFEPSNNVIKTLQKINMINLPIEKKVYKDSKLISSFFSQYYATSYGASLGEIYKCDFSKVSNNTGLDVYGNLASNSFYQKYVILQREGLTGNIVSESIKDVLPVSYIWGYNYTVPVVQLENLMYHEIPETVKSEINRYVFSNSMNYVDILKDINFIKGQLAKISPEKLFATIYTYKPLIGMTSSTDARGVTTYYTYDTAGRLTESYIIENGIKKTIESYNYNYRTN